MINIDTGGFTADKDGVAGVLKQLIREKGVTGEYEVNVFVVDEETMTALHMEEMKLAGPTDVLSFPLEFDRSYPDGVVRLGDIVVCYPVAARQAAQKGHSTEEEIEFLAHHGCLHLLGIHHPE